MAKTTLTPKQRRFGALLLTTTTLESACAQVGVSIETGRRWRQSPLFQAYVEDLTSEAIAQGLRLVADGIAAAVVHVRALLTDRSSSPMVRLHAAKILLDTATNVLVVQQQARQLRALADEVEVLRAHLKL